MGAKELTLVLAGLLFIIDINAWLFLVHVGRQLRGQRGENITRIVRDVCAFVVVAQFFTLVNAWLIHYDASGTLDFRVILFAIIELLVSLAILVAAYRVWRTLR